MALRINAMPVDSLAPKGASISGPGIACVGQTACIVVPNFIYMDDAKSKI